MPVALQPANPSMLERGLIIGGMGVGKSEAICALMKRLPNSHFHAVDTDDSLEYQIAGGWPEIEAVGNYTVHAADANDWTATIEAVEAAADAITPGDWFTYDCSSEAWQAVQQHGRDQEWWRLDKNSKPIPNDLDWVRVNADFARIYNAFKQVGRQGGHVLVTSDVDALGDKDEKQMRVVFGPFGVKPRGQKTMWRQFHSIVLLRRTRQSGWSITTVRERAKARELLDEDEIDDFAKDYLMRVAGWKMRKVD